MKSTMVLGCILLLCTLNSKAFNNPDSAFIMGCPDFLREGDTVTLQVVKCNGFTGNKEFNTTYRTRIKNAQFKFSFALDVPAYFTLLLSKTDRKLNIIQYLIEPGDSIKFDHINPDSADFSGKGADRLKVQLKNRKIRMECLRQIAGWGPDQIRQTFAILDAYAVKQLDYIKLNKKILGDTLHTVMMADVLGESGLKIDNFFPYNSPVQIEGWLKVLKDYSNPVWKEFNFFDLNNDFLQYSCTYSDALIAKYRWDFSVITGRPFKVTGCYEYFAKNYTGTLRERIVMALLYQNRSNNEDLSECLRSALTYTKNENFLAILKNMHDHLSAGSVAYDFELADTSGIMRRYSEFKGKVVLLDFWFTGCSGCIAIHPKIDSIISLYKKEDIVLISISIDKSKDQWIQSVRRGIYTSDHGVNLYTGGLRDAHPIISYYLITAYPSLFIIDKEGKLCDNPVDPRLDNGRSLVELIGQNLKF